MQKYGADLNSVCTKEGVANNSAPQQGETEMMQALDISPAVSFLLQAHGPPGTVRHAKRQRWNLTTVFLEAPQLQENNTEEDKKIRFKS